MNIRTLNDSKKNPEEKKSTQSYAGGKSSGLAIQNPEDVNSIVSKAGKQGSQQEPQNRTGVIKLKITLWQNGFQVDDGEFRDYENPKNKQFMAELNQERVPTELYAKTMGKPVDVALEDKREEKYTPPPPPAYIAFSGSGNSLGGGQKGKALEPMEEVPNPQFDPNKPTTTIQLRLHNGKRVNLTLNHDQKVLEIHNYLMYAAPVQGSYQLLSGFPPKPVENASLTIKEAGLLSSQVIQKIV